MPGRGMSGRGRRGKGGARRESPQEARERMMGARSSGGARQAANEVVGRQEDSRPAPPTFERAPGAPAPPNQTPPPPLQGASHGQSGAEAQEPSTGELVKQLTEQTKTLVQQEMRLAQVELQEKGKKFGLGAGMFGAGGLVAFLGTGVLIGAIVLALSTALAAWLAAVIVAAVLLAVAGAAALMGKKQIEQAAPAMPEQTVENVKEDVEHVKSKAKR